MVSSRYTCVLLPLCALLTSGFLLAGCKEDAAPTRSPTEIAAHALALKPADARLAELYASSCKACHATTAAGAPLTGDKEAWKPRLAKGEAELMHNVVSGFKGMPAGGQCFGCSSADYRALIRFMAYEEGKAP